MKNAYAYIRVSTVGQAEEGFSLDNQKNAIKEYSKNRGIHLVRFYMDEGRSGRTVNRPEFQSMLADIEARRDGDIDSVIIYKIDRFARNIADFSRVWNEFKERKINLISLLEGDISNGSSLIANIFASVAQWESEVNGQRTKDALMQKFKEGWQPTPPPLGYRSVGEKGEKKSCEPDPYTSPIVQELFHLYSTGGYSIIDLTEWLSEKNIVSKKKGLPLGHSVIHTILSNPFYYGVIRWHGESKAGNHSPIISKELFDTCQYVLAKHRHFVTRKRKYDFLLRGFLYCGVCGQRYTAEWHYHKRFVRHNGKLGYYHCQKRDKNGCDAPFVMVEDMEKQVDDEMKKIQFSDEFVNAIVKKTKDYLNSARETSQARRQAIVNVRSGHEQRKEKLENSLLDDLLDRDSFKRKYEELNVKIRNCDRQLQEVDSNMKVDIDLIEEVLFFSRNIYLTYKEAPFFLRRHYLRFFFERLVAKNKLISEVKVTPVFESLIRANQVITSKDWLPRLDSDQ